MEMLKSSVPGVCLMSIAVAVCTLICPETSLKKQVKFLISLIFIISLVQPFTGGFSSYPELEQMQSGAAISQTTEQTVKTALTALLAQSGISCTEISVSLHIDEKHCISISDVSVTCDDYQNAVRILRELLGEEVTLHVSEILE